VIKKLVAIHPKLVATHPKLVAIHPKLVAIHPKVDPHHSLVCNLVTQHNQATQLRLHLLPNTIQPQLQ
jgi:hypothetical protein